MAKRYIDAAITDTHDSMSDSDGSALTLTNSVRLLYDNTVSKSDLVALIDRIKEKIIEVMP